MPETNKDIDLKIGVDLQAYERELRAAERLTKQYADRMNRLMRVGSGSSSGGSNYLPNQVTGSGGSSVYLPHGSGGGGGGGSSIAGAALAATVLTRRRIETEARALVRATYALDKAESAEHRAMVRATDTARKAGHGNKVVNVGGLPVAISGGTNPEYKKGRLPHELEAGVTYHTPALPRVRTGPTYTYPGMAGSLTVGGSTELAPYSGGGGGAGGGGGGGLPPVYPMSTYPGAHHRIPRGMTRGMPPPVPANWLRRDIGGIRSAIAGYGVYSAVNSAIGMQRAGFEYDDAMRAIPSWAGGGAYSRGSALGGVGDNIRTGYHTAKDAFFASTSTGGLISSMTGGRLGGSSSHYWADGKNPIADMYEGKARSDYFKGIPLIGGNSSAIYASGISVAEQDRASRVASTQMRGAYGRTTMWQGQDLASAQAHSGRTAGLGGLDKALSDIFEGASQKARELERELKANPTLSMSGDAWRQMRQQQQQAYGAAGIQAQELRREAAYSNSVQGFAMRGEEKSLFQTGRKDLYGARRTQVNTDIDLAIEADRRDNQGAMRGQFERIRKQKLFLIEQEKYETIKDRVTASTMNKRQHELIMGKKFDEAEVQAVRDSTELKIEELKRQGLSGTDAEKAVRAEGAAAEKGVLARQAERKRENLLGSSSGTREMFLRSSRKYLESDLEGIRENYRQRIKAANDAGEGDTAKELGKQQTLAEIQAAKNDISRKYGQMAVSTTGRTMSYAGIAESAARASGIISNEEAAAYLGKKGYANEKDVLDALGGIRTNTAKFFPVAAE